MSSQTADAARESPPIEYEMKEIRIVGRGGQGVVTAGDLLGKAALTEGRYAQSIPTFGPERRGALASCTVRVSAGQVLLKCSSMSPDTLLVLDPTIWHHANILLGFKAFGSLVFNSPESPEDIDEALRSGKHGYRPAAEEFDVYAVDATGIAIEILGRPITNTAMMGALSGATGVIGMPSIESVLTERFGAKAGSNVEAARAARDRLRKRGA